MSLQSKTGKSTGRGPLGQNDRGDTSESNTEVLQQAGSSRLDSTAAIGRLTVYTMTPTIINANDAKYSQ
jgi:hypothetical protein